MKCGIVGPPLAGKTTLFNILTGSSFSDQYGGSKRELRRGVAHLADPRLEAVARVTGSAKITPAAVEYIDVPGVTSEKQHPEVSGYPPHYLSELRTADMLALLLREFKDDRIPHQTGSIDTARDLIDATLEFIISDHAIAERRLKKLAKTQDKASQREEELLERCRDALDSETALREFDFKEEEKKILSPYSFLSLKPLLVVVNVDEETAPRTGDLLDRLRSSTDQVTKNVGWVAVAAGIEEEICNLEEDDRREFLDELGFKLPALDRIIEATFSLLGLITFLTSNEKETHAWAIPAGSSAVQAARTVHEDFARGFIRAEVCRWDELVEAGSSARLREMGKMRLEGKKYIIQDGDLLDIRFNV
ncbi:redox-regulated ATPase YchF [bacterium]|nr:redox-regulated ATPase YchF [bacterium]